MRTKAWTSSCSRLPEHQRAIVAAEAEGIVHRVADVALRVLEADLRTVGRVGHAVIEHAVIGHALVGRTAPEGARQQAVLQRQQGEYRFDDAGCAEGMPGP